MDTLKWYLEPLCDSFIDCCGTVTTHHSRTVQNSPFAVFCLKGFGGFIYKSLVDVSCQQCQMGLKIPSGRSQRSQRSPHAKIDNTHHHRCSWRPLNGLCNGWVDWVWNISTFQEMRGSLGITFKMHVFTWLCRERWSVKQRCLGISGGYFLTPRLARLAPILSSLALECMFDIYLTTFPGAAFTHSKNF